MRHRRYRIALLAAAAASSICASARYASAQERVAAESAPSTGLEDIIVTARKRTESLIDVPVAVSSISAKELQRQGVSDLNRIAQLVPQVIMAKGDSGAGATFSIRGLGSPFVDAGIEQSVTVNLDGVPITRGNLISQGFFDLEQVEVLKGPQALFFGKNSPAGVISLRTAGGTDTLQGYARLGYEFDAQEKYGEAAISGPLSDTLTGRVAIRGTTMRGWLKNVARPLTAAENPLRPTTGSPGGPSKYAPGARELMGRLTLNWDPSDRFDATLKLSGGKYRDHGTTTQAYCRPNEPAPSALGLLDPFNDCKFDDKLASAGVDPSLLVDFPYMRKDGMPYSKQYSLFGSLTMNYKLPNITITSVTGYMRLHYNLSNDFAFTSHGSLNDGFLENFNSFSQEVRLTSDYDGPLNFMMGGYYERGTRSYDLAGLLFFVGPDPATGKYHTLEVKHDIDTRTASGFGQIRWALSDKLELAGGVRWTEDKRTQLSRNTYVNPISGPILNMVVAGFPVRGKFSDSNWSPEFTLTYKPVQDMMVYAAYKTGYKSGGFSAPSILQYVDPAGTIPVTADDLRFAPEKSKGGEIGMKALLFDRSLRFEGTVYRYKYSGLQVTVIDPATFNFFVRNAASARIQGVELSSEWRATKELTLNAGVSYNRARFVNFKRSKCYTNQPTDTAPGADPNNPRPGFCGAGIQDLSGEPLARAPDWTINVGGSYDTPISGDIMLGLNADVNYMDSYFTQEDHDPFAVQNGFARINAGARIYSADNRYEFAIIGRNLTNKRYIELSASKTFARPTGEFQAATPRAREVRAQVTYRF